MEKAVSDWSVTPVKDDPIDDAKLLGLGFTVNSLYAFLNSDTIISPLVIAVNGEWGSGKTSLITTLKKKLDSAGHKTVFFDAWKYEYSDPPAALVWTVSHSIGSTTRDLVDKAKQVSTLALDIFVRKYASMNLEEIKKHFSRHISAVETLDTVLNSLVKESVGDKKIIVFIDDLDRCSLENVIKILETLKLFLSIKNFIFVMAVDMSKVKLAWAYKYGKTESLENEGLEYLEKIIQIETSIPKPTRGQINEYVASLNPALPEDLRSLIALTDLGNPRKIKRLLNLISLRCHIEGEKTAKKEVAFIWTALEAMASWAYTANMFEQYGGAEGFYNLLLKIDSMSAADFKRDYNNKEEFKRLSETYGNYEKMHAFAKIAVKILGAFDKEKVCRSLADVVNFSNNQHVR